MEEYSYPDYPVAITNYRVIYCLFHWISVSGSESSSDREIFERRYEITKEQVKSFQEYNVHFKSRLCRFRDYAISRFALSPHGVPLLLHSIAIFDAFQLRRHFKAWKLFLLRLHSLKKKIKSRLKRQVLMFLSKHYQIKDWTRLYLQKFTRHRIFRLKSMYWSRFIQRHGQLVQQRNYQQATMFSCKFKLKIALNQLLVNTSHRRLEIKFSNNIESLRSFRKFRVKLIKRILFRDNFIYQHVRPMIVYQRRRCLNNGLKSFQSRLIFKNQYEHQEILSFQVHNISRTLKRWKSFANVKTKLKSLFIDVKNLSKSFMIQQVLNIWRVELSKTRHAKLLKHQILVSKERNVLILNKKHQRHQSRKILRLCLDIWLNCFIKHRNVKMFIKVIGNASTCMRFRRSWILWKTFVKCSYCCVLIQSCWRRYTLHIKQISQYRNISLKGFVSRLVSTSKTLTLSHNKHIMQRSFKVLRYLMNEEVVQSNYHRSKIRSFFRKFVMFISRKTSFQSNNFHVKSIEFIRKRQVIRRWHNRVVNKVSINSLDVTRFRLKYCFLSFVEKLKRYLQVKSFPCFLDPNENEITKRRSIRKLFWKVICMKKARDVDFHLYPKSYEDTILSRYFNRLIATTSLRKYTLLRLEDLRLRKRKRILRLFLLRLVDALLKVERRDLVFYHARLLAGSPMIVIRRLNECCHSFFERMRLHLYLIKLQQFSIQSFKGKRFNELKLRLSYRSYVSKKNTENVHATMLAMEVFKVRRTFNSLEYSAKLKSAIRLIRLRFILKSVMAHWYKSFMCHHNLEQKFKKLQRTHCLFILDNYFISWMRSTLSVSRDRACSKIISKRRDRRICRRILYAWLSFYIRVRIENTAGLIQNHRHIRILRSFFCRWKAAYSHIKSLCRKKLKVAMSTWKSRICDQADVAEQMGRARYFHRRTMTSKLLRRLIKKYQCLCNLTVARNIFRAQTLTKAFKKLMRYKRILNLTSCENKRLVHMTLMLRKILHASFCFWRSYKTKAYEVRGLAIKSQAFLQWNNITSREIKKRSYLVAAISQKLKFHLLTKIFSSWHVLLSLKDIIKTIATFRIRRVKARVFKFWYQQLLSESKLARVGSAIIQKSKFSSMKRTLSLWRISFLSSQLLCSCRQRIISSYFIFMVLLHRAIKFHNLHILKSHFLCFSQFVRNRKNVASQLRNTLLHKRNKVMSLQLFTKRRNLKVVKIMFCRWANAIKLRQTFHCDDFRNSISIIRTDTIERSKSIMSSSIIGMPFSHQQTEILLRSSYKSRMNLDELHSS